MPVYNGERFVREALESLLGQTFTDFELIISDNCSIDNTEQICRAYAKKDDRIVYVRQEVNRGPGPNFKFVLDEAIGDYFMWAAADDVWDLRWIEDLLPIAVKFECLAYGLVSTINEKSETIKHPANNTIFDYTGYKSFRKIMYFLDPPFYGKANPIYGLMPRKLITDEAFEVLTINNSGSDMLFLFNILNKTKICSVGSVYLNKRIHSECAGVEVEKTARGVVSKIHNFIKCELYRLKLFKNYSSYFEAAFIQTLFPFYIVNCLVCKIIEKLGR